MFGGKKGDMSKSKRDYMGDENKVKKVAKKSKKKVTKKVK